MSGTEMVRVDEKYETVDGASKVKKINAIPVQYWFIDEESREGDVAFTDARFGRNRILNGRTEQKRRQTAAVAMSQTANDFSTPLVKSMFNVFDTSKCQRWLENLEFYLEQEQIGHVLTEPCPDARDPEIAQWKEDDFSCRNFILRTMFNPQLCVNLCRTAKELWDTIKTIYTEMAEHESWRNLRMNFFMHQREVVYVLTEPCPDAPLDGQTKYKKIAKWKEDDYSCRNLILQELVVPHYANYMTAKELWDTLQLSSGGKKKEAEECERSEQEGRLGELKKMVTRKEEEIERLGKLVRQMGKEIGSLEEEVEKKDRQVSMIHASISSAWRHLDPIVRFSSALVLPTTSDRYRFHRMDTAASTYQSNETTYDDEFNTELWNLPGDNSLVRRNPTRSDILKQKPTPFNSEIDSLKTRSDLSLKR